MTPPIPTRSKPTPSDSLPPALREALTRHGYTSLTPVQEAVTRPEFRGKDLRISSQTGSGKTVALGMVISPLLHNNSSKKSGPHSTSCKPQAIVLTPTRELALQVETELAWLLPTTRTVTVMGGTSVRNEQRELANGADLIVATPGRFLDHLKRNIIDISEVAAVVLDEADQMLDLGFRDDLEAILAKTPETRQTHLVSATFSREVLSLANRYQHDAVSVEGTPLGDANADIEHVAHLIPARERMHALVNILLANPDARTLVFVRTRADATETAERLMAQRFPASVLMGNMEQRERTRTLEAFRSGGIQILVATDVAARGIDVPDIGVVVHADLPGNADTYTHRSGRTGRAGRKGMSVLLVPASAHGTAVRMMRMARVPCSWVNVPGEKEIMRAAGDQLRQRLLSDEPPATTRRWTKLAQELLQKAEDPQQIVERLIALADPTQGRAAFDIPPLAAPANSFSSNSSKFSSRGTTRNGYRDRDQGPAQTGPRDAKGARSSRFSEGTRPPRAPRTEGSGSFVAFRVTWGTEQGAVANKLLALLCRRGNIQSSDIGKIRIDDQESMVEVSSEVAETFASATRKPDARDPHIRVLPSDVAVSAGPPQRSAHRAPSPGRDGPPPRAGRNAGPPPRAGRDGPPPRAGRNAGPPPRAGRDGPPPRAGRDAGPPPRANRGDTSKRRIVSSTGKE